MLKIASLMAETNFTLGPISETIKFPFYYRPSFPRIRIRIEIVDNTRSIAQKMEEEKIPSQMQVHTLKRWVGGCLIFQKKHL